MKDWVRNHVWLTISIAFIVGVLTGVGAGDTPVEESATEAAGGTEQTEADTDTETTTAPEPAPEAAPDATFTQTCDYLLDPYHFIGTSQVRNTGNIGAVVRITFLWGQAGASPVREVREIRLRVGQARTVNVDIPATIENIERLQALPVDQQCKVRGNLFETFGLPVD